MLAAVLALSPAALLAQTVYKWVDADGKIHYSSVLPPEVAAARPHQRLTAEGLVAERVERVSSEDELAELEARKKVELEARKQRELEQQQDRLFLAAFPTEDDVRRAFGGRRDSLLTERRALTGLREQTRERFAELVAQAAQFERAGNPVPPYLSEQIDQQRSAIRSLNQRLAASDQRLEVLERELAEELERHRRLTRPVGAGS
ncbi:MAG: DUF4124 domain-containing protein [Wenzhouxiangellaceae bacterium]|nr:DUF4124 domain-containing protein [Wenzhouxiangellaceae bacterium]